MDDNSRMRLAAPLKEAIARAVAFGVWQDAAEPNGLGLYVIKGARLLLETATGAKSGAKKIAAIPCADYEQAVTARDLFGEPDRGA